MSKKAKKMRKAKKTKGWSFHVCIENGIHPCEILKDLSRKTPVALVSIKDNDYDEYEYAFAVGSALLNKAMAINIHHPALENIIYQNESGIYFACMKEDFNSLIKWAKHVKYSEVPEDVRVDISVKVSLPKI